jgi:hypothetical protein
VYSRLRAKSPALARDMSSAAAATVSGVGVTNRPAMFRTATGSRWSSA